jgi:SAM-dependent methyltransferase
MDRTALTIESYDGCAATYARTFRDFALYEAPRRTFAALLSDGARVLDLGCGPGTGSAYLRDLGRGFVFEGCDLSSEMITLARREIPDGTFLVHDLRDPWPFRGPYDAILASFCIVHLDPAETAAFLDRLVEVGRPGTHLALSWIEGSGSVVDSASFSDGRRFWYCRHQGADLRRRLESTGWYILRELSIDYSNPDGSVEPEGFLFARL